MTRKILRIGKFVENLKAAAVAFDNKGPVDPVLRVLSIGRQLGYAGYLFLDSVTVIDSIGVKKLATVKKLQANAYRAWLTGLVCSAVAGVYTLWRLQEKEKKIDRKEGEGVVEAKKIEKSVPLHVHSLEYPSSSDRLTDVDSTGTVPLLVRSSSPTCATSLSPSTASAWPPSTTAWSVSSVRSAA